MLPALPCGFATSRISCSTLYFNPEPSHARRPPPSVLPLAPLRNAPPEPPAWVPSLADMEAYAQAHPHDVGAAAAAAVAEVDGPAAEQAAERRAADAQVGALGCIMYVHVEYWHDSCMPHMPRDVPIISEAGHLSTLAINSPLIC